MGDIVAKQDLFMNATQDECVTLKSGDAAYLLVRKGRVVPRTHTKYVTQKGNPKQPKKEKQDPSTKEQKAVEDKTVKKGQ